MQECAATHAKKENAMLVSHPSLRQQARQRIDEGRLTTVAPGRTFGGPGSNCPCAVCDETIAPSELEYEVAASAGAQHFHIACFTAWFLESKGLEG
jgi:hypothetical protein